MKNIFFAILSIALLINNPWVYAQEDEEPDVKYIFKSSTDLKGFASFDMRLTNIVDDTGLILGGTGGVTVNKYFLFGVGGYGIVTKTNIQGFDPDKQLRMYGGYGGLLVGFNLFPREVVHISIPVLIGAGNIDLDDQSYFTNSIDGPEYTIERSAFFIAEPGILIELNVTNFFHLGIGGSWRLIDGLNLTNLDPNDISDWSANISFKFGRF